MAEKKHVIEYIDIIKSFEKVKEKLKNKSDKGHQHGNADITDIDASKIKSGTIDIDRLPKGAIERMVYVKDDAARFALTTNTAQNGDTVKVRSTKKMFYIIDDTKLSSEAGYEPYTAESASAVPWSGVTGKPTTFTPETHTHAISEVADLQETLTGLRQDVNAKPSKDTNTTYSLIQDSIDGHKLTFKGSDGSTKTVTIPDNDHNDNTWRDVVDSLDSARTDASLSANQGRVLNGKFASYLPLSGGDMTGDITFNGYGASTIGNGSQDGAGLDAKNNLNIASWYGVSFTSKCAGFAYSDKPGVSIDCRNGTLAVAGAIYANGGVVGDLTGNAKTATTANSANSANELKSITLTGTDDNTAGFRLIASINVGAHWSNYRANFIVRSRYQGNGLLCIAAGCNSNVHNKENTYAQIRYYGNTSSGDIIKSSRYQAYLSPDCKTVYLFWLYEDYSEARLTPVYGSDFEVSNGAWMTSIDESTYGTCIAQTEINCANGGYCDNSIVSENANHLYNIQTDGVKNSMTFHWDGKDGQPTWLWGGEDGSNMYVYNPSNFAVDNAGSIRDSSGNGNLLSASYSKDGLDYSEYTWLAAWNGTELRAVTKGQFATAGHTHGLTHSDLIAAIDATSGGWDLIGGNNGFILKSIRTNASAPKWTIDNFSAAIAFGGADTKGIITIPYSYAGVKFAGGNGDSPRWYFDIYGTNEKSYNLDSFLTSHQDISGKLDKSGGTIAGTLHVKPTTGSYTEGMRIYPYDKWSTIMLNGTDNTGTSGTSPKSWGLFNNDGQFYITKNGANTSPTAIFSNTDGTWRANGHELITAGNIGSQNVNYANSAGSANSVAWTNVSGRPSSLPASDVYAWAKASSKPSYSWSEIGGRPTALSSFTNDRGFITGSDSRLTNARPASDVYSWAKASSKPSYTASEVGAAAAYEVIKVTPMNSGTSHELQTDYSSAIIRIGNLCVAMCGITGTIYPRTWYPVAQIPTPNDSKIYLPTKQTNAIICGISGSDHMEVIIDTKGFIKVWWSGSSPVTSANFCIPYYIK